jgi:3-deoxy-manno-octulosonate cytidylyltransferase (CMP-KDO synthetase)
MENKIVAMIPARMESTRFPGKPIIDICGKSMIEHVWQRVSSNKHIKETYVATCNKEIKAVAEKFGANVIMTSNRHVRCTDRIAEACSKLLEENKNFDIVLNIQGDEPLINPQSLDLLVEPFLNEKNILAVNLIEHLEGKQEIEDYNNVKAIIDQNDFALYFSRLPIPYGIKQKHYKQLGVYALSRATILQYLDMPETPLEIAESVDMLRFIENGIPVKTVLSPFRTIGVDVPFDHKKVEQLMKKDEIFKLYKNS